MFIGYNLAEFREFDTYVTQKTEEYMNEILPVLGKYILDIMKNDTRKFVFNLSHNTVEECPYYKTPILNHIKPEDFVSAYLQLTPENRRMVIHTFTKRYEHDGFLSNIHTEKKWLINVKYLLSEKQKTVRKLSKYHIQITVDEIAKLIERLTHYEEKKKKILNAEATAK